MRSLCLVVLGLLMAGLAGGCSGTGEPAVPPQLASLRTAANDHLTALLMVKRWLAVLYVRPAAETTSAAEEQAACTPRRVNLPLEPSDPPDAKRYGYTMSDCATAEALLLSDGSGQWTFRFPDAREKTATWSPPRREGDWTRYTVLEEVWGDVRLEYEYSFRAGSPKNERSRIGTATLGESRSMAFVHERNDDRDLLMLTPDDGARLEIEIPMSPLDGTPYWPAFAEGATGAYRDPHGQGLDFRLRGTASGGWENWRFTAADGLTGQFALGAGLTGSGELRDGSEVRGALRWGAMGEGTLEPVGASVVEAVPSAAARDFQFDEWIGNIAAMGPTPLY